MKKIIATVFFLLSFFYMVFVLGGVMSTLGTNETALQRIIFTFTLFIFAALFLASGIGVSHNAKWSRVSGIVAALMGATWCCIYTIMYKIPVDSFLIIQVAILLCVACFLIIPKVKERFKKII